MNINIMLDRLERIINKLIKGKIPLGSLQTILTIDDENVISVCMENKYTLKIITHFNKQIMAKSSLVIAHALNKIQPSLYLNLIDTFLCDLFTIAPTQSLVEDTSISQSIEYITNNYSDIQNVVQNTRKRKLVNNHLY